MPPQRKSAQDADRLKAVQAIYADAQAAKAAGDLQGMAAKLNELGKLLTIAPKQLKDLPIIAALDPIRWDEQHTIAAISLAEGRTQAEAGEEVGVSPRTIRNWLQNDEFRAEVDRLSLMLGIACRAERIRLAQRAIRQKLIGNKILTDKDVLDWLKFAQSETDGVKLDLGKLAAAFGTDDASMAGSRPNRTSGEAESESVN